MREADLFFSTALLLIFQPTRHSSTSIYLPLRSRRYANFQMNGIKRRFFFACDLSIKYFKANFFVLLCDSLNEMFGYIFLQFNVHKLC